MGKEHQCERGDRRERREAERVEERVREHKVGRDAVGLEGSERAWAVDIRVVKGSVVVQQQRRAEKLELGGFQVAQRLVVDGTSGEVGMFGEGKGEGLGGEQAKEGLGDGRVGGFGGDQGGVKVVFVEDAGVAAGKSVLKGG
jgi:hypothetical protein